MSIHESHDYEYAQLAHTDSIRLLELLPGSNGSPLACHIFDVRKNDAPEYEALSYVWGEPTMSSTVYEVASHATVHITSNLSQALHAIRFEHKPRMLWIDAICINQSDLGEKGHQVALMGQIYRNAQRVVVWLGHPRLAPNRLQSLLKKLVQFTKEWHSHFQSFSDYDGSKMYGVLGKLSKHHVFNEPWYRRVWVVQEYMLAQEIQWVAANVVLQTGLIEEAVGSLQSLTHDESFWGYCGFEDLRVAGRHIHQLFSQRHKRLTGGRLRQGNQASSLASCLFNLSAGRECEDPRDRLYAMLAIADDDLDIQPDYSLSISTVFADFAKRSLLKGDLTVLHMSGLHPDSEEGSSSLAPWISNRVFVTNPLDAPELRFSAAVMLSVEVIAFAASMVSIRGVRVDVLSVSMDSMSEQGSLREHYQRFARWFMFKRDLPSTNGGVEDLSYDQLYALTPTPPYTDQYLRTTFGLLNTLETYEPSLLESLIGEGYIDLPIGNQWQKDCTIFRTEQGYLGLGPYWKQPGDQVAIFDGAPNPVLLRKVATKDGIDHWHLVGECYLLGWMHGDYFGHIVVRPQVCTHCASMLKR